MASVENPVGPPIPELSQAIEECPEVLASMRGEEARNIFEEDGGRSVSLHKVEEGEGEGTAGAGETGPLAGDAEVLAGEAAGPEASPSPLPILRAGLISSVIDGFVAVQLNDVTEVRDSGPSLGEDGAGVGLDLGEADGPPSGSLKPKVKSSDA